MVEIDSELYAMYIAIADILNEYGQTFIQM